MALRLGDRELVTKLEGIGLRQLVVLDARSCVAAGSFGFATISHDPESALVEVSLLNHGYEWLEKVRAAEPRQLEIDDFWPLVIEQIEEGFL